ncbi:UDP-N-acetylglucosamine 2-epimerase [[Clostridium] sordellii]|uniref:non-hydrolyzing UDP-N-acetylglucosamine 2-epimerase n=1 Tax=Paraclostridium sordellii TaxID=1505 RepID=UPI0005E1118B|nr:UDP-N-acetylglucosamine 2-epimerase (non-hydrolyzing) [Paeniclostridium sordellii]CEN84556.1 UDP-N-acetylglucosamine 2-epimerase [[Clostridium] sordellii] [Paeniclostridium sordellii]CEO13796.1 UDP-N-acetylglucosamine 2-epimerase [[Clostridium] sordellii] [Paeniclostridium sordellii]
MKKLKLMTIVGTRPEIIRLSEVIKACDKYFDNILVHTGQNWDYTLNEIFFEQLELRQPNHYLGVVGNDLGETMGNIISESYKILSQEKPDALLILGDTNSCLSAIAAKRLKVPVFHMEAGNRCFDQNVPEEINRKIVDHVSDINLTYTEHSRRYLLSEGARKDHVMVTGSPMPEVLKVHEEKINNSDILDRLGLEKKNYIVVSAHREENIDLEENFNTLMKALNTVAEIYNLPLVYSTHPRAAKIIEERNVQLNPLIKLMRPMGLFDYCNLQKNAFCTLSDSGTLSEESSILEFPAVLIRTSTERPEVLDKGTVVVGGIDKDEMLSSIEIAVNSFGKGSHLRALDYRDENVSIKIVKIIQSYTKIINKVIWNKK